MAEKDAFDKWCQQDLQTANKEHLLAVCLKLLDELQSRGPIQEELKQELMNITDASREESVNDCSDCLSGLNLNEPAPTVDATSVESTEETIYRRLPDGIIEESGVYKLKFIAKDLRVKKLQIEGYLRDWNNRILFLGEGDFSFSAAVATLRNTWTDIIPSDLKIPEQIDDERFRQITTNILLGTPGINIKEVGEFVNRDYGRRKAIAVDATQLSESYKRGENPVPDALYFQCPWERNVSGLIAKFFESAATFQKKDEILFLGICIHGGYYHSYGLKPEVYEGYSLEGVDTTFCKQMVDRGYTHCTGYDPANLRSSRPTRILVQENLITLCFIKN